MDKRVEGDMKDTRGGKAFPSHGYEQKGMDLRDYLAGQYITNKWAPMGNPEATAKLAYEVADAMIAERNRDNKGVIDGSKV